MIHIQIWSHIGSVYQQLSLKCVSHCLSRKRQQSSPVVWNGSSFHALLVQKPAAGVHPAGLGCSDRKEVRLHEFNACWLLATWVGTNSTYQLNSTKTLLPSTFSRYHNKWIVKPFKFTSEKRMLQVRGIIPELSRFHAANISCTGIAKNQETTRIMVSVRHKRKKTRTHSWLSKFRSKHLVQNWCYSTVIYSIILVLHFRFWCFTSLNLAWSYMCQGSILSHVLTRRGILHRYAQVISENRSRGMNCMNWNARRSDLCLQCGRSVQWAIFIASQSRSLQTLVTWCKVPLRQCLNTARAQALLANAWACWLLQAGYRTSARKTSAEVCFKRFRAQLITLQIL